MLPFGEFTLKSTARQDNAALSHDGVVENGTYSFLEDRRFCEYSNWPETKWLMFDVIQQLWVNIPALARIDARYGPLITRQNDSEADLSTYEGLASLIREALDTYESSVDNPHTPTSIRRALLVQSSSQTAPETSSPIVGASRSRKRARKY